MSKKKNVKNKKFGLLIPAMLIILAIGSWLTYSRLVRPAGINEVASGEGMRISKLDTTGTKLPNCVPNPCAASAKDSVMCKLAALPDGQTYCPVSTSTDSVQSTSGIKQPNCVFNPCPPGTACKLGALPEGQVYCPNTPTPTTIPSPIPKPTNPVASCKSNLLSISMKGACASGGFLNATYVCNDPAAKGGILTTNNCVSALELYQTAQSRCGQTCPGTACKPENGYCVTVKNSQVTSCSNYTNSCEKATICLPQYINESCE